MFKKFLNWMNKMGKIWQKFDKKSQFWIFFQYNHVLKPSQWIETSRFHMEMFWGFQKGIKHVSISNGCGVGSYNQGGLIFIFKTFWCVFYSRGSSIQGRLIIAEIRYTFPYTVYSLYSKRLNSGKLAIVDNSWKTNLYFYLITPIWIVEYLAIVDNLRLTKLSTI